MPIEIRELNIRVSVNQSPAEQGSPAGGSSAQGGGGGADKDQIIAECVDQIMEILKNKNER